MAVRVRLSDGIRLLVRADLDEFTKAYQKALKNNEYLEVENGSGKMRRLNPLQILYFEAADESSATDAEDPVAEAAEAQAAEA